MGFRSDSDRPCDGCSKVIIKGEQCVTMGLGGLVRYYHTACKDMTSPKSKDKDPQDTTSGKVASRPVEEEGQEEGQEEMEAEAQMEDDGESQQDEAQADGPIEHQNFELLWDASVIRRKNTYMYGPVGTGKGFSANRVAEKLGIQFRKMSLSQQTAEWKVFGWEDGTGTYHASPLRDCWENGGVMCLDEMDNASANLLNTLCTLFDESNVAEFPDQMVPMHKDFILICCGNTAGRGGDPQHRERRYFDGAYMDRFKYIHWPLDEKLETHIAKSRNDSEEASRWIKWVQSVRSYCKSKHPELIVSPRASIDGVEFLVKGTPWTMDTLAEATIFRGLNRDTVSRILSAIPFPRSLKEEAEAAEAEKATADIIENLDEEDDNFDGLTKDQKVDKVSALVATHLKNNKRILAVKVWMKAFNTGLTQASEKVDALRAQLKKEGAL